MKGEARDADLAAKRDELRAVCAADIVRLAARPEGRGIVPVEDGRTVAIRYPVLEYPARIASLSFDKTPEVGGKLMGIKGQYLMFDGGAINVRKFAGYHVAVEV